MIYTHDQLEAALHIAENGLWLGDKGTQWNVMAERIPRQTPKTSTLDSVGQILAAEVRRLQSAIGQRPE